MLKRIKVFFREWNDVTKGMGEAPEDTTNLELLPINMEPERAKYEKLGFCFYKWRYKGARGKMYEMSVDQVMCLAKLPEGWVKKK